MYQYKPHSHVKIWLSNNPNVFMNLENQIRLIDMREKNPTDAIHLVYDAELLTPESIHALLMFCKEHNILPIDAHNIQKNLTSDKEIQLYHFYKDEIYNLKTGGNLGVASDILRWLSPICNYGTYTDFDIPVDTSFLPVIINTEAPLLLNIGSLKMGKKEFILANNDFVAIVDAIAAKKEIERVQNGLLTKLTKYDNNFIEKTEAELRNDSFLNPYLLKFMKNRSESIYIAKSKEINPSNGSLSSLKIRTYIREIMSDKNKFLDFNKKFSEETHQEVIRRLRKNLQNQLNLIKYLFFNDEYTSIKQALEESETNLINYLMQKEWELYLKSIVICTTGPIQISNALFNDYVVDSEEFKKEIEPLSFNYYGLQKAFQSQNSIPLHANVLRMLKFLGVGLGKLNDSSWLEAGEKLQTLRTKQLKARQEELALNLPVSIALIKNNIETYMEQIAKNQPGFFLKEKRNAQIKILELILTCFNHKNEFSIKQFKKIMPSLNQYKPNNYIKKLIVDLDKFGQDAVLFNLTKDQKIKLVDNRLEHHKNITCKRYFS